MTRIYLDYNASTPIAPEVVSVIRETLDTGYGNPSSVHWAGVPARERVDVARAQVARLLDCAPEAVVFTSGGTEANNFALKGAFFARQGQGNHFITTQVEHPAIIEPLKFLQRLGATVTWLPVDSSGRMDPDDLRRAITGNTILISIMHANNEVGTIQPIESCAAIAREYGVAFHTDAAQSVGKVRTRVDDMGVDLLSLAGHKCYAPKGIGALYVREGVLLERLMHGAGHEGGRRAGTESALLTAALGRACELVDDLTPMRGVATLRDRLWAGLSDRFGNRLVRHGHASFCLPNTLNVSLVGVVGGDLLAAMPDVAASTGSACHSGRVELSPVLEAMGVTPEVGMGAIRFSLGRGTTDAEVDAAIEAYANAARVVG